MPLVFLLIWFFPVLIILPTHALAAPVRTPHVEAELIAKHTSVKPGDVIHAALRLKIKEHWHTYWLNPGDSGLPTKLSWSLPQGFTAGPIQWPYPKRLPLGPLTNFGYEGEVLHLVDIATPTALQAGRSVVLKAKADWLVCSDVCIPESAELTLTLPIASGPPQADPNWADAFMRNEDALPGDMGDTTLAAVFAGKSLFLDLPLSEAEVKGDTKTQIGNMQIALFPESATLIAHSASQKVVQKRSGGFQLEAELAEPIDPILQIFSGVLVSQTGWGKAHPGKAIRVRAAVTRDSTPGDAKSSLALNPTSISAQQADLPLLVALAFAFLGGVLLNLMPCVFPVLGIKVLGFVQHAKAHPQLVRRQGVSFFCGVLISFWILAAILIGLRAGGESLGWGFQLQSPAFVTLLAALFLLMALNLAGVYEIGFNIAAADGHAIPRSKFDLYRNAFLSGILATLVATPCTAPFMGAALGLAFLQPGYISLLVCSAIGVGMALPVLLLSWFPRWLNVLPRPGPWMITFKQFMAFPLFATVAWLVWVLGSETGNDGVFNILAGLVLLGLGAWGYGRWQISRPGTALLGAGLLAIAALYIAWPAPPRATAVAADQDWLPYSKSHLAELRQQGKAVFVDFTATWCITCQVNKKVALNAAQVEQRFRELSIVRMKADWTKKDPAITEALAEFGRNGVPLYVYYPANQAQPKILPEILTPGIVLDAIQISPTR